MKHGFNKSEIIEFVNIRVHYYVVISACCLTGMGKIRVLEKLDISGKPTKRVQFTVIDINDPQRREKTFELSKVHIEKIYEELKHGKSILEISRAGQNKDTRYFVKAVR
jgi:hypothetical protein